MRAKREYTSDEFYNFARVPEEYKRLLINVGLWDEYLKRRDAYKNNGLSCKDSRSMALAELLNKINDPVAEKEEQKRVDVQKEVDSSLVNDGLVDSEVFDEVKKKKKSNALKDLDWIYHNVKIKGVDVEDAPSPGAYFHLIYLRKNPMALNEFYRLYIGKRLPSQNDINDLESRLNDDGEEHLDFIDKIRLDVEKEAANL